MHKSQSQGSLLTRRGQKRVKMTTSKFCHFWPNRQYPPPPPPIGKNSIFGIPANIHRKAAKRISVFENLLWDTFWNSQRDQRQRNRPKMKLGLGLKRLLRASSLFVHKSQSQGSLLTRRGQKRVKMTSSKFCHFWPNRQYPPIGKNSIFGIPTNIHRKAAKRISVFENLLWDTFWNSQGTRDKEIDQR